MPTVAAFSAARSRDAARCADHIGYQSGNRFSESDVRRRLAWSLLGAPTAGVTYGGHRVWGWDDGSAPPQNHPTTGVARPWQEALHLDGAEQIGVLVELLRAIECWRLRPAPEMVLQQNGGLRHISASRTVDGSAALIYVPEDHLVRLDPDELEDGWTGTWTNAENGEVYAAEGSDGAFATPGPGDWWLAFSSTQANQIIRRHAASPKFRSPRLGDLRIVAAFNRASFPEVSPWGPVSGAQ